MKNISLIVFFLFLVSCRQDPPPPAAQPAPRPSTAAPNVMVLPDSLAIPGLHRKRLLRIYVPPAYASSQQAYPVLYLHDGQNIFDDSTSYVGEWGVDEILNELADEQALELIVVGIDNGQEKRLNEMSPWPHEKFGKAEGREYTSFIISQVKPLIDSLYRTLPGRENTGIMGSSMGGFISHYAVYEYPEVFGKAGIFSPSYWYAEEVFGLTEAKPVPKATRLFMIVGERESETMVPDTRRMHQLILSTGHPAENLYLTVDPLGTHSEGFWRENFREAVTWLYASPKQAE